MPQDGAISLPEEQAFQLSQAALKLDLARGKRDTDPAFFIEALNQTLEVWVALRTIVMRDDCTLPPETRQNLTKLSQFVAEKVFLAPDGVSDSTIDTLININLQISEGLLEGKRI